MFIVQLIILQVIVFSAVIFFMKKILYTDTQTAVGRLDEVYQDLLKKQKELTKKIEEAEKEYQAKKQEVAEMADKMTTKAMDEIRGKKEEVLTQAKDQADEIIGRGRAAAEEHHRKIEKELQMSMIDRCIEMIHRSFDPKMIPVLQDLTISAFLERAKDFDLSNIGPGVDTLTIKTARPLTKDQTAKINSFIASKLDRTLKVDEIEDDKLIAGVLLQFGTLMLDGSLANSIREVAEQDKEKIQTEA